MLVFMLLLPEGKPRQHFAYWKWRGGVSCSGGMDWDVEVHWNLHNVNVMQSKHWWWTFAKPALSLC